MGNYYQGVANTIAANNATRQNAGTLADFIKSFLQAEQQKKYDDIANSLMSQQNKQADIANALQNAPKAKAVSSDDPDLQGTQDYNPDNPGPVTHYTDGSSPGDPPTRAQEAADNSSLGYSFDPGTPPAAPGDLPATGGYAELQMRNLVQGMRAKQDLENARTSHLYQLMQGSGSSSASSTAPVTTPTGRHTVQTPLGYMTPESAALYNRKNAASSAPAVKPQFDSWQKLNSDLNIKYGHGFSEFRDAGAEDTLAVPGGVMFRMGGNKGANGVVQPKQNVFVPQADFDQMNSRLNGLTAGKPTVLNASQVYNRHIGVSAPATAQPATGASGMYQNFLNNGGGTRAQPPADPSAATASAGPTPLPQDPSAASGALFGQPAPVATSSAAADVTPPGPDPLSQARAAIAAGADPAAVKARLANAGVDTSAL